ncbi:MAG: M13 family metallopeptidase [Alphaproteobacteria bacterium]|nr:M13 family metallopeptidase [Alphaproteobacteria bacterium]
MKHTLLNIIGIFAVLIAFGVAIYEQKEKKMTTGINAKDMDMTVVAGDDFYDFATRGWRNANPIPDDYVRYGAFDILANTNLERVREIAEHDKGKVGKLYKIAMDEKKLNTDGVAPVAKYIAEIDAIKSRDELPAFLGHNHSFSGGFFSDGVALDEKDSEHYLYNITQGGIGLSRDYYFDDDDKSKEIRKKYIEYMQKQLANFGISADTNKIFDLEKRMAKSFYKKEKLRDPLANYHKKSIDELKKEFSGFNWDKYFATRNISPEFVDIAQPEALQESIKIMNDTDLELLKNYLKWFLISSADGFLDDKTYDIAFEFTQVMTGQNKKKPRWKRAVSILDGSLGEEVGKEFSKKYFPEAAKKRMQNLVKNLQSALKMRIQNLEWMSDDTKKQALEKLETFHAKIGYPDVWRDYSKLEIKDDSLYDNMVRVAKFEDRFWLDKIGKRKDPNIWFMNAHEVNAYYDPSTNEICFPAGILEYPFFDMAADDAFNYGSIGVIIGHEMTHGFDDSGRHFDKDGNMRDWWTEKDAKSFTTRANVMRDFFNNIIVAPNVHANGEFTLGENLADYGGITVAWTAYTNFGNRSEVADGFNDAQRFFIAYAMNWASNIRDEALLKQTKTNEHSLERWRVNGILPHIDAWYDAFGVTKDNKMYVAPEKRVKIW